MLWVLFTFPSRYLFTIGLWRVFSLGGWARRIHTGFHVPRATQDTARRGKASGKGLSPSMAGLSRPFPSTSRASTTRSYNPDRASTRAVWAVPRSLATTEGITFCFLFLPVLRCFSSRGSPHRSSGDDRPPACRVAPFGDPWIKGCLLLPTDYRSLPRPSSPSRAKASAIRPCFLSP